MRERTKISSVFDQAFSGYPFEPFIGYVARYIDRFRVSYLLNIFSLIGIYNLALLINSAIIFIT